MITVTSNLLFIFPPSGWCLGCCIFILHFIQEWFILW